MVWKTAPSGAVFALAPDVLATPNPQASHRPHWPGNLWRIRRWTTPGLGRHSDTGSDRAMDFYSAPARCAGHPIQEEDALCHVALRRQQRGGLSRPHGQYHRAVPVPIYLSLGDRLQEAEQLGPPGSAGGRRAKPVQHRQRPWPWSSKIPKGTGWPSMPASRLTSAGREQRRPDGRCSSTDLAGY